MRIKNLIAVPTLALALAGLTACSGGDDEAASSASTSPETATASAAPAESATPEASTAPEGGATASGDFTAPGTEVPTTDPITVPLVEAWYNKDTEELEEVELPATYTFDGIRAGKPADLASEFGDEDLAKLEGFDLYYVDYTVTLVNGPVTEQGHSTQEIFDLDATDTAGAPNGVRFISFSGGPEACSGGSTSDLDEAGTVKTCQIVAATKGETVATLEFAGDNDSAYDESPITWVVK